MIISLRGIHSRWRLFFLPELSRSSGGFNGNDLDGEVAALERGLSKAGDGGRVLLLPDPKAAIQSLQDGNGKDREW